MESPELSIATRDDGARTVMWVSGEIDLFTAPRLLEAFIDLIRDGRYHLVMDLQEVGFLDSTGLTALVNGLKRVRVHDGSIRLVCTRPPILMVLRTAGLLKVFSVHDTIAEALADPDD